MYRGGGPGGPARVDQGRGPGDGMGQERSGRGAVEGKAKGNRGGMAPAQRAEGAGAIEEAFAAEGPTCIDLSYRGIQDSHCQDLVNRLEKCKTLKELSLAGNDIGVQGSLLLASALSKDCTVEILSLEGNALGEDGVHALSESLRTNVRLRELNLNSTGTGLRSLINIADSLTTDNRSIETIRLANPKLLTIEAEHILYIARMLACNPQIKTLDLSKHTIRDTALNVLLDFGLCRNSTLENLSLSCCQLTEVSAENIRRLLVENKSIKHLDLSRNQLSDVTAASIASGLRNNSTLESLSLKFCQFSDKGLSELAEAIFESKTVKSVQLWGNAFGQGSGSLFSQLLQSSDDGSKNVLTDFATYVVDGSVRVAAC